MVFFILAIILFIFGIVFPILARDELEASSRAAVNVICMVLAVICVFCSVLCYVNTGYTGILVTFGKVHDNTIDAGIHFKAPWDKLVTMDNREQRLSFEMEAFSSDIQEVLVKGSVNISLEKSKAMRLYRDVGVDYSKILVMPRIMEDTKSVFSQYTAEMLIENRDNLSKLSCDMLRKDLEPYGLVVVSVSIEDIDFSDAFTTAVEAKQVATQDYQRNQTIQQQQTMEARQAAERREIQANADAAVAKINADAAAYTKKVEAEAEASANKAIAESLTIDLLQWTYANRWDGKLPGFMMGGDAMIPEIRLAVE